MIKMKWYVVGKTIKYLHPSKNADFEMNEFIDEYNTPEKAKKGCEYVKRTATDKGEHVEFLKILCDPKEFLKDLTEQWNEWYGNIPAILVQMEQDMNKLLE